MVVPLDATQPAWNVPEAGSACGQDEARWRRWTHMGPGCSKRRRRLDASAATHRGPQVHRLAPHRRARRQPSTAVRVGVQCPRHGEREREGHEGERDERRKKTGVIWSITKKNIEQVSSGML